MNLPLANYENEQTQFKNLLLPESRQRILMFQGQSGSGKTRLLEHCLEATPPDLNPLLIQLRGGDVTVSNLLYRLGRRINWQNLPRFTRQIAILSDVTGTDADWQISIRRHLESILQTPDSDQRRQIRADLTDAWFADVHAFDSPFLLFVDTYEQATEELKRWFNRHFLPWVADTTAVRIVIAGQEVPATGGDWLPYCSQYELQGVPEAKAWLPVAEAMGRVVPSIDFLEGACLMAKGNPSQILDFIRLLPQTAVPVLPQQTITENRKRLRQNLEDHFNNQELRALCFDLSVKYENIGDSQTNQDKVIGLIEYMERRGRLPELINLCRKERPHLEW